MSHSSTVEIAFKALTENLHKYLSVASEKNVIKINLRHPNLEVNSLLEAFIQHLLYCNRVDLMPFIGKEITEKALQDIAEIIYASILNLQSLKHLMPLLYQIEREQRKSNGRLCNN